MLGKFAKLHYSIWYPSCTRFNLIYIQHSAGTLTLMDEVCFSEIYVLYSDQRCMIQLKPNYVVLWLISIYFSNVRHPVVLFISEKYHSAIYFVLYLKFI
jgi:hypothetical protein